MIAAALIAFALAGPVQGSPVAVLAPELSERPELIGKAVVVEGRQPKFTFSRAKRWDEFRLLRSPVRYRLPASLVPREPPAYPAVRVEGVLKKEGAELVVDVKGLAAQPADLDRLRSATALLRPDNVASREKWARWAEARAQLYEDEALAQQAARLLGEVVEVKAARPDAQAPGSQLGLAEQARRRGVPEPEPSALAHRGFRALLASARSTAEFEALAKQVEAFFPSAKNPAPAVNVADWLPNYRRDPYQGYRRADPAARATLDRMLLADAIEQALERRQAEDPGEVLAVADAARSRLPDRPEVADRLLRRGLEAAEADPGKLRLADAQKLAQAYRDRLNQPERGKALLRKWLDHRRDRTLGPSDAEGRLLLADQYEQLAGDRAAAVELLREAWAIDPGGATIAEAFRRRGYRQDGDNWAPPTAEAAVAGPGATGVGSAIDPYLGLTKEEVRSRAGKPARVARVATQGQLVEQWQYEPTGRSRAEYFNFVQTPGQPRATVISHGTLR